MFLSWSYYNPKLNQQQEKDWVQSFKQIPFQSQVSCDLKDIWVQLHAVLSSRNGREREREEREKLGEEKGDGLGFTWEKGKPKWRDKSEIISFREVEHFLIILPKSADFSLFIVHVQKIILKYRKYSLITLKMKMITLLWALWRVLGRIHI